MAYKNTIDAEGPAMARPLHHPPHLIRYQSVHVYF